MPKKLFFEGRLRAIVIACLYFSLLAPLASSAQKVRLGVKAGVLFSNCMHAFTSTSPTAPFRTKAGFTGGLFLLVPAGKQFSFRPGLEFARKGFTIRHDYSTPTNSRTYTEADHYGFTYLDLPLTILYALKTEGGEKLLLGGGPVISYYLNDHSYYSVALRKMDVGAHVMAGCEWPIGASINFHFTQGLSNVSADKATIRSLKNYYYGITLGYWF